MESRRIRFSGHQTFSFRYGWLEKGYSFMKEGHSFNGDDALIHLGVGKNMVESIKYWCEIFSLLENNEPTSFARNLLDTSDGWDPYLEDDASLWLLHWKMCSQKYNITAGSLLFGEIHKAECSKQELRDFLLRRALIVNKKEATSSIVDRDIECYLKSYAPFKASTKKNAIELSYACPLQELGLITMVTPEIFCFSIGQKSTLPPEIFGYALSEYISSTGRSGLNLSEVLYGDYAPGQIFMLNENSIVEYMEYLQNLPKFGKFFVMTASAGIEMLHCTLSEPQLLLKEYYQSSLEQ